MNELLCRTLTHLSNDRFQFEFRQHRDEIPKQFYLEFGEDEDWPFYDVERVVMFSGGLDSLAGAAESLREATNLCWSVIVPCPHKANGSASYSRPYAPRSPCR